MIPLIAKIIIVFMMIFTYFNGWDYLFEKDTQDLK